MPSCTESPFVQTFSRGSLKWRRRQSGRGHEPVRLGAEVDARGDAEAHAPRPFLDRRVGPLVRPQRHVVEVGVARVGERRRQLHRLVLRRVPVHELLLVLADRQRPGALDLLDRAEQALLHRRQRRDGLERGARRIEAGDGAVQRGVVRGRVRERLELLGRDAAQVDGRVERGVGREREHLARVRIHGDDRAAVRGPLAVLVRQAQPVLERVLGRPLEARVDRQLHRVAGLGSAAELAIARHLPERVHADLAQPGRPAEVRVVRSFDAGLPDPVAGRVALLLELLQLLGGDLGDVAEELRGEACPCRSGEAPSGRARRPGSPPGARAGRAPSRFGRRS